MKKNVTQDIIPPRRSIQNIDFPSRSKRFKEKTIKVELSKPHTPPPQVPVEPELYQYDEPPKYSRKLLYIAATLLVLGIAFAISALFKSAEIKIAPKQEIRVLNSDFTAKKNATGTSLAFQVGTTTKDIEKVVSASTEQKVDIKARGQIVIYNNYSTQSQKLVATTRFVTPEGLIFRLVSPVTVPGQQVKSGKTVAGSVEATVEADTSGESYNIGLKDFTIPGFKGDSKYTKIYARSKTEMTGGFQGLQKIITKEALIVADAQMENDLKAGLAKDITSQIPENFILYEESLSYKLDPATQVSAGVKASDPTQATLRKKGRISGIIFDKGALSRTIIAKILPDTAGDMIKITNLNKLNFTINQAGTFDSSTSISLGFSLSGDANLVWIFDENKLKADVLGLSKKNAMAVISTYKTIKEAWIETSPFWNSTIPKEAKKVTLVNTLTK